MSVTALHRAFRRKRKENHKMKKIQSKNLFEIFNSLAPPRGYKSNYRSVKNEYQKPIGSLSSGNQFFLVTIQQDEVRK